MGTTNVPRLADVREANSATVGARISSRPQSLPDRDTNLQYVEEAAVVRVSYRLDRLPTTS